jgi:hypothetical protein
MGAGMGGGEGGHGKDYCPYDNHHPHAAGDVKVIIGADTSGDDHYAWG